MCRYQEETTHPARSVLLVRFQSADHLSKVDLRGEM